MAESLYEKVKNIIVTHMPKDEVLDFNDIIEHLQHFTSNALKTHKWNKFVRLHFLYAPTEIRCIICKYHFVTIYNSVLYNVDEAKSCEEIQIKNLLE